MWICKNIDYVITLIYFSILYSLNPVMPSSILGAPGQTSVRHEQDPLEDWSDKCVGNVVLNNFLTLTMGQSDTLNVMISPSRGMPNCTITIKTSDEAHLIVVIEFPDNRIKPRHIDCKSTYILIFGDDKKKSKNACKLINEKNHKHHTSLALNFRAVYVQIYGNRHFEAMKLTATTARIVNSTDNCNPELEVSCERIDDDKFSLYCMTVDVACDGHPNCGFYDLQDENVKMCGEKFTTYSVMLAVIGIIVAALASFFLVRLIRCKTPRMGTNFFVFNEDEDNRLDLKSVFRKPLQTDPDVKHNITSRSSCYRFTTSTIQESQQEREIEQSRRQEFTTDSMFNEVINTRATPSATPTSDEREIATSSKEESNSTQGISSQPPSKYTRKYLRIASVEVEAIANIQDEYRGPSTSKGISDPKKSKKKNHLIKSARQKDLISRKVHEKEHDIGNSKEQQPSVQPPYKHHTDSDTE